MIEPRAAAARPVEGEGSVSMTPQVSVRLVDPGPHPLEVVDVLTGMGCPPELAADYVAASAGGAQTEVLVGARPADAARLGEALRVVGATVSVVPLDEVANKSGEPSLHPHRQPLPEPRDHRQVTSAIQWQPSHSNPLEVDTVERYIAAYNHGDCTALVQCLSATAVLSDATGQVLVHGAQGIGRRMADVFEHYPDRQITVLGRLIARPWVLDNHRTTFGAGKSEETVMCFRVEGDLIVRLVLLR